MQILALIGSYRKNGNTAHIVELILRHMQQVAAQNGVPLDVETINLAQADVQPCKGCRVCMDRGEAFCPVKDDLPAIKARMQAADGLLVASPVYVDDVSGTVKIWIDRLAHACHRPEFAGKCAYSVATVGGSPTRRTLGTLNQALTTWGFYVAGGSGFKTGALMGEAEIAARHGRRAAAAAETFFQAVAQRKYLRPSFRALMTFKIQQRAWQIAGADPIVRAGVDYRYWEGRGWLDPRVSYYIPHQAGRVKTALARMAGAALAPLVT